jgi:flagellar basal-body rod protein FlgB
MIRALRSAHVACNYSISKQREHGTTVALEAGSRGARMPMKTNLLQDATIEAMGSYMTRLSKRQQVIASNLANIDTPGFRARDISFHTTMQELLAEGAVPLAARRPGHNDGTELRFAPLEPEIFEVEGLPQRPDRNNVDIDGEMLKLGQTSFGYSLMSQLLRIKFRTLSSSINEGRVA